MDDRCPSQWALPPIFPLLPQEATEAVLESNPTRRRYQVYAPGGPTGHQAPQLRASIGIAFARQTTTCSAHRTNCTLTPTHPYPARQYTSKPAGKEKRKHVQTWHLPTGRNRLSSLNQPTPHQQAKLASPISGFRLGPPPPLFRMQDHPRQCSTVTVRQRNQTDDPFPCQ